MASRNRGGRPKNNWTPTMVRKLARLATLGSCNVKTIQKTLARVEEGFDPCLGDVYIQLAKINPGKSRRHKQHLSRSEQNNMLAQLKPGRSRISHLPSLPTETLLASRVEVDGMYNPLAHWDYLVDTDTPRFITLGQVMNGSSATTLHPYQQSEQLTEKDFVNPGVQTDETMGDGNFQLARKHRRDVRKTRLQSVIAHSELSFVVSLLSSRWSKSSSHTRALSYSSMTDRYYDSLWNITDVSDPSTNFPTTNDNQSLTIRLPEKPTYKFVSLSLLWRPCCGLYCAFPNSAWKCHTCGFSSALHQVRFPQHQKNKPTFDPNCCSSNIAPIDDLINMAEKARENAHLPNGSFTDCQISDNINGCEYETPSATVEYLEARLQSVVSDRLNGFEQVPDANDIKSSIVSIWDLSQLNDTDYFGNTALHHAAVGRNFDAILELLIYGTRPQALNTDGQTFLHVLDVKADFQQYLDVLRRLVCQTTAFPFWQKDHHGNTIASQFALSAENTEYSSPEILSEIQSLLENFHLLESQGAPTDLDFEARCDTLPVEEWASGDRDIAIEIDKHGATCLMTILKRWSIEWSEENLIILIKKLTTDSELKADVNAYDEDGDTPLIIAARKGLCLAVHLLLSLGANPNAQPFSWPGTLLQIVQSRRQAAQDANKNTLYTALLRCEKVLVEFGAKFDVSALDGYISFQRIYSNNNTSHLFNLH